MFLVLCSMKPLDRVMQGLSTPLLGRTTPRRVQSQQISLTFHFLQELCYAKAGIRRGVVLAHEKIAETSTAARTACHSCRESRLTALLK